MSSSFKWVPNYILFLAKLDREGRPFWRGQANIFPLNHLLHIGIMLTIINKSIHHPIPTLSVGIGNTLRNNFQNKWISLYIHSKWINQEEYIPGHSIERIQLSVQVYTFLDQTEEEGKTFLGGARSWAALWDYPQEHLVFIRGEKVCPLVKFEIIIPLLCGLLNAVTNKRCRAWSSMINLWIDSRTCQKKSRVLLSGAQRSNN